jgi:Asp-tRNA(Asn)/Glu-tRNA(Gln) amidotransferase A subunit family amidase
MLSIQDYRRLDAVDLANLIRHQQVSAVEVRETVLLLAEAQKRTLNALTTVFDAELDQQLRQVTANHPGPLAGVPMMIKDIGIFFAGTDNWNGGGPFLRLIAPIDSTITQRYRESGLVIFGKTTTCEMALNVVTESRAFGPTRNPHNLDHGVGGSSGGAGAVVGAGIVPIAHGSDNGGSIRIPASSCGVYGLKPSRGLVPSGPSVGIGMDVSEGWSLTNCNHVLTRSVRDSALALDIETGSDGTFSNAVQEAPAVLKVAVLTSAPMGTPIDPICIDRTLDAARRFETLGWRTELASFQVNAERLMWALRIVAGASLYYSLSERSRFLGRERLPGDVETITALWAEEGRRHTAAEYVEAIEVMTGVARDFGSFLERWDLVLTPTLAEPPLKLGACPQMGDDLNLYLQNVYANVPFLPLFNLCGGPAASLPLWITPDGLPIGVQIGSKSGQDRLVISASAAIERAIGFTPLGDQWLQGDASVSSTRLTG